MKIDSSFRRQIESLLFGKPHLDPVFNDLHRITERIRDIDPTLFIARDHVLTQFQVHSTAQCPDTYCWTIPWRELDGRTLEKAFKNSLLHRSVFDMLDEMDRANDKFRKSQKRHGMNKIEDAIHEAAPYFAKTAWEGV